jgi:transposase
MKIKKEKNLTFEATAERFGIGIRTLFRWQNKIEPQTNRNKPATKINMDLLKDDVKLHPDDYLFERAERFNVSTTGIFYALRRLGISYKKNSKSS